MDEEEIKEAFPNKPYKIMPNDIVSIIRNEYEGRVFYKARLTKKESNGNDTEVPKILKFPENTDLPDGCHVILKEFFEDAYYRKQDRFNPVWYLVVLEYERADVSDEIIEYHSKSNENDDFGMPLPF